MDNVLKRIAKCAVVLVALAVIITLETVTFAWLSTAWNGGDFAITTASTNAPAMQIWTKHETDGWFVTYDDVDDPTDNKVLDSILTTDSEGHLKAANEYSLYFGTIHNLVQTQDNPPVYIKATFNLSANSTNTVTLHYSLPTKYVTLYSKASTGYITEVSGLDSNVSGDDSWENLSGSSYDFLQLDCYYSVADNVKSNYIIDSTAHEIRLDGSDSDAYNSLNALFDSRPTTGDANGKKDISGDMTITLDNNTANTKTVYVYYRFTVPAQSLKDLLTNTNVKDYMPIYLIFDTNISFDIVTTAYSA